MVTNISTLTEIYKLNVSIRCGSIQVEYTLAYGTTNVPTSAQLQQTLQNNLNSQGMLGPYQIDKTSVQFSGKQFHKFS